MLGRAAWAAIFALAVVTSSIAEGAFLIRIESATLQPKSESKFAYVESSGVWRQHERSCWVRFLDPIHQKGETRLVMYGRSSKLIIDTTNDYRQQSDKITRFDDPLVQFSFIKTGISGGCRSLAREYSVPNKLGVLFFVSSFCADGVLHYFSGASHYESFCQEIHIGCGKMTCVVEDGNYGDCESAPLVLEYLSCWGDVGVNPRPLFIPHLVQLSLHDSQLPTENNRTDYPRKRDRGGQADHPAIASINTINKRFFGYGLIAAGYSVMVWGGASPYRCRYWRGWLLFGGSALLAFHAIALIFG
jgi:hypothetical protein